MFTIKKRDKIERRNRQIQYISQFTNDVRHISVSAHIIADMLSRPETSEVVSIKVTITPHDIAREQKNDDEIQNLMKNKADKYSIRVSQLGNDLELICSRVGNIDRPIVPKTQRFSVFQRVHGLAHLGIRATLKMIRSRYFWPRMTKVIRKYTKCCVQCQKAKIIRHTRCEIGRCPEANRFEHLHVDIVVLKTTTEGYRYAFTMIDRATRWLEVAPLKNIEAETIAATLYETWITRYGTPLFITSDQGQQFLSDVFLQLRTLLGSHHIKTTTYHPQSNGLIERQHRILKNALKAHNKNWLVSLPTILLGIRAALKDNVEVSPAEIIFGINLRIPGEFYEPAREIINSSLYVQQLRDAIHKITSIPINNKTKNNIFVSPDLKTCKFVFLHIDTVKTPLEPPYEGPYEVLK